MKFENLRIDLSDLELQDIEILAQEGARGIPEFAASTGCEDDCTGTSCTPGDGDEESAS